MTKNSIVLELQRDHLIEACQSHGVLPVWTVHRGDVRCGVAFSGMRR